MTTTPLTTTVYLSQRTTGWHTNPDCDVLDTAQLVGDRITETTRAAVADRRPCLMCADDATEWTVTADTVWELWELIGPSKPHSASAPDGGVEVDGLTVWEHGGVPRTVARFGDTIRFTRNGRYVVTHATAQES